MARRTCRGRTARPAAPLIRSLRGELLGRLPKAAARWSISICDQKFWSSVDPTIGKITEDEAPHIQRRRRRALCQGDPSRRTRGTWESLAAAPQRRTGCKAKKLCERKMSTLSNHMVGLTVS